MEEIVLTPIQVRDLQFELEHTKLELEKARENMRAYKETESNKTGYDDYTVLDNSYYENISQLIQRISEIEDLLTHHILAEPKGKRIQVGSLVELADSNKTFMVVQERVVPSPDITEVSMDSPIFGAIYMRETGDICEYTVGGKTCKCVIGNVDNAFCNTVAKELLEREDSLKHGSIIKKQCL